MQKQIWPLLGIAVFAVFLAITVSGQTSRPSVSAAEVNGTFRMNFTGKYRGSSNEISILALGKGKLRIYMDLMYPYTMANGELMANMGELDGEATIEGDIAVYRSDDGECKMTIKFVRSGMIRVKQTGTDAACGFGHNVYADGDYKKISSAKPKFNSSK
jgi:hypothetical protein